LKETLRHRMAFDYYYSLGNKRSYLLVSKKFTVSQTSIKKWASAHNWMERVRQRDIEIARKLEKKTNDLIVNSKADYRKEIRENLKLIKAILSSAVRKIKSEGKIRTELLISVESAKNVADIIQAYEKLVKLDLVLMGEADSRAEEVIRVEVEE